MLRDRERERARARARACACALDEEQHHLDVILYRRCLYVRVRAHDFVLSGALKGEEEEEEEKEEKEEEEEEEERGKKVKEKKEQRRDRGCAWCALAHTVTVIIADRIGQHVLGAWNEVWA